jgi:hypothetical protein
VGFIAFGAPGRSVQTGPFEHPPSAAVPGTFRAMIDPSELSPRQQPVRVTTACCLLAVTARSSRLPHPEVWSTSTDVLLAPSVPARMTARRVATSRRSDLGCSRFLGSDSSYVLASGSMSYLRRGRSHEPPGCSQVIGAASDLFPSRSPPRIRHSRTSASARMSFHDRLPPPPLESGASSTTGDLRAMVTSEGATWQGLDADVTSS